MRTARAMAGRPSCLEAVASPLDEADVDGLGALHAGLGLVGDLGTFGERAVPVGVDGRVVNEEVLAGLVGRDEPEAFLVAEPLHSSGSHVWRSSGCPCAAYSEEAFMS